jgi:hypothetical protein
MDISLKFSDITAFKHILTIFPYGEKYKDHFVIATCIEQMFECLAFAKLQTYNDYNIVQDSNGKFCFNVSSDGCWRNVINNKCYVYPEISYAISITSEISLPYNFSLMITSETRHNCKLIQSLYTEVQQYKLSKSPYTSPHFEFLTKHYPALLMYKGKIFSYAHVYCIFDTIAFAELKKDVKYGKYVSESNTFIDFPDIDTTKIGYSHNIWQSITDDPEASPTAVYAHHLCDVRLNIKYIDLNNINSQFRNALSYIHAYAIEYFRLKLKN